MLLSKPSRAPLAGVLAIVCGVALHAGAAAGASVVYATTNSWNSGVQGEITLAGAGVPLESWELSFDYPHEIETIWGAAIAAHEGTRYTLHGLSWNRDLPAAGSVVLGFVAAHGGSFVEPSGFALQGAGGGSGGTPPPDPDPDPVPDPDSATPYTGYGPSLLPVYNYGEALQQAWFFYEAQRSGPLPRFDGDLAFVDPRSGQKLHDGFLANRIPWRGDSDLIDGDDVGLDLTGGWHDAGDHVKFGLPMAFSASFLAWGVLEFEDALEATGQLAPAKDNLRWVADYFVRAHPEPNLLYGQVGVGEIDHQIWGAPELMPHARPAFAIDLAHPGPDLAAQTAAALAAISLVFRDNEPVYADALLAHAVELYAFAQATRQPETPTDKSLGRYSDSILDAQAYYASTAGAQDDLPFAAAWLYVATGDAAYLHAAEADYTRVADNTGHTAWTAVWDDVRYGLYFLMAQIASEPGYPADSLLDADDRVDGFFDYDAHARNFLDHWLADGKVARTPGGMAWLSGWASARYNTMTAFLALVYRKQLAQQEERPDLQENYLRFATEQLNYVLGDNPLGMSYVVGVGPSYSQVAHHRAAHGSTTNSVASPELPRFVLHGGLAGGPTLDDGYTDDRNEFQLTEVACDMNAGLNGALAGLVDAWGIEGNAPAAGFPPQSPAYDEIFATAILRTQQPASLGTQVEVIVVNETAYSPRFTADLRFRYFVDLSELLAAGFDVEDVVIETYRDEGSGVSGPHRFRDSASIFYIEGSFAGTALAPRGEEEKQKTIEFLVRLPWGETGWDAANDPSFAGLVASAAEKTTAIAVYDGVQRVWGVEPDPGAPAPDPDPDPEPDPDPDPVPGVLSAVVELESQWESGYCAGIRVVNGTSEPVRASALHFTLPAQISVTQSWNGTLTRAGDAVDVVLPGWVGEIPPGGDEKHFGFCADGATLPSSASAS